MTLLRPLALLLLSACDGAAPATPPLPPTPVSAFTPRAEEGCTADYAPRGSVCVHRAYTADDALVATQIADYERGARPPMVPAARAAAPRSPTDLPPGALSADTRPDPAEAHARRLAAIEATLTRLRAREAATSPSAHGARPSEPSSTLPAGGAEPETAPGGLAGKLAELRHLVQRLPAQDTAELSKQLRRDGFTEDELRGLVPTPR